MEKSNVLHQLREANKKRVTAFGHTIEGLSPTDWACAVAGETGELCNLIKKLHRGDKIDKHTGREINAELIGSEAADIVIYLDLLAQKIGFDLSTAIVNKFNEKSEEIGSSITIYYY
jgi:NTP pyrophosphatase (non-canonical NTP hydrolase)